MLAAYDRQLRRDATAEPPGRVDRDGRVVRSIDATGGWEGVIWSGLDAASADGQIARQQAFFAGRGRPFEWKHHDYDQPADLPARLLAAGFVAEEAEELMVAEVATLVAPPPADGFRVVEVDDAAGVDLVVAVHEQVFGVVRPELRAELLGQLAGSPPGGAALAAMAGGRPVSAARVTFAAGTDFASLWGGGTLPQWRGRGIYRALVAARGRLAAERGYRYLTVDALPPSRPILERLGFVRLATTTPYRWTPPTA